MTMTNRVTRIRYGPGRERVEKAELQPVHIQPAAWEKDIHQMSSHILGESRRDLLDSGVYW
jgi:hypothetical protein